MECTYLHVGFFNDPLPESSNFKTLNFLKQYKSKLERADREYASFKSGLETFYAICDWYFPSVVQSPHFPNYSIIDIFQQL
jgi:hypothetical protein